MQFWQLTGSQRQSPSFGGRLTWGCSSARLSISNLTKEAPTQNYQTHFFFFFFLLNSEWLWLRQVSRQAGRPYIKNPDLQMGNISLKSLPFIPQIQVLKPSRIIRVKQGGASLSPPDSVIKSSVHYSPLKHSLAGSSRKYNRSNASLLFFFSFCFRLCGERLRRSGDENLLQSSLTCPLAYSLHIFAYFVLRRKWSRAAEAERGKTDGGNIHSTGGGRAL